VIERIKATIVADAEVDVALVEAAVPPGGAVDRNGGILPIDDVEGALEGHSPDVLLVACKGSADSALRAIERAGQVQPDLPVVALCEAPSEQVLDAVFEAGADDVVSLPESPEGLRFSLEKTIARRQGGHRSPRSAGHASMLCVLGPKGGVGKTFTACNVAAELASSGVRPVIVDLDLQFGDVGLALGLSPDRTLYDLATSGGALDGEKLTAYLARHSSGAEALLAPVRPDQAGAVSVDLLEEVYTALRSTHDVVIVDTPPDFTPHVIGAIDAASQICMVGTLDALSLKNTKLGLETLDLMGSDPDAITLVLNRAGSDVGIEREDVVGVLGRTPDVLMPSDRAVPRSLNEGGPLVLSRKGSPVAAAIRQLAEPFKPAQAGTNGDRGSLQNGNGRRFPFVGARTRG
jgi:pilus assembly protein CpaE